MLNTFFRNILLFFCGAAFVAISPCPRAEAMPPVLRPLILPPRAGQGGLPNPLLTLGTLGAELPPAQEVLEPQIDLALLELEAQEQEIDLHNMDNAQAVNARLLNYINGQITHIPTHLLIDERFIDDDTLALLRQFTQITTLTIYSPQNGRILSTLYRNNHITELHIVDLNSPADTSILANNITTIITLTTLLNMGTFHKLKTLYLKNLCIDQLSIVKLLQSLQHSPQLEILDIRGNEPIHADLYEGILSLSTHNQQLHELELSQYILPFETIINILDLPFPQLQSLYLQRKVLTPEDKSLLRETIKNKGHIKYTTFMTSKKKAESRISKKKAKSKKSKERVDN